MPVSVLLSAHCDEIGFLVNDVTKNGFLRLVNTFGIDPNIQAGQRVYVYNKAGRVPGVIGKKVRTACNDQERRRALQIMDIFVDIGAVSRQQAMEMVAIATRYLMLTIWNYWPTISSPVAISTIKSVFIPFLKFYTNSTRASSIALSMSFRPPRKKSECEESGR